MLPSTGEESEHYANVYKMRPLLHHRHGKSRHTERENGNPAKPSKRVKVKVMIEPEIRTVKPRKNVNFAAGENEKDLPCFLMPEYTNHNEAADDFQLVCLVTSKQSCFF